MSKDIDSILNPLYYKLHKSGAECIEITRHLSFNLGNVIKYIWRLGEKGDAVVDLKKAKWYLEDEIKRLEELSHGSEPDMQQVPNPPPDAKP